MRAPLAPALVAPDTALFGTLHLVSYCLTALSALVPSPSQSATCLLATQSGMSLWDAGVSIPILALGLDALESGDL